MSVEGLDGAEGRGRGPRMRLHHQLEDHLRETIADLPPGTPISSERQLGASLGVSRTTVRLVIGRLVNEGVLSRSHGSGTFVSRPKIRQRLVALRGFTADIEAAGQRPGARLIRRGTVPATEHVAADLDVPDGTDVIYLERVRTVDDIPLTINRSHYRPDLTAILHNDVERQSVWDLLAREHGVSVARGLQTIDVVALGARDARLLGERPGALSVRLQMVTFGPDRRPVESIESLYRAGLVSFSMELFSEPCEGGQETQHGPAGRAGHRVDGKESGPGTSA